jgi:hypothetical protein
MIQNKPENAANENAETEIDLPERTGCVRALLVTVIVLGILLVGGLAVVVGTIIKRVTDDTSSQTELSNPQTRNGSLSITDKGFKSIISVPVGAALMATEVNDKKIVLHLRDEEGDFLLLLNVKTGQEIGRVRLKPQQN